MLKSRSLALMAVSVMMLSGGCGDKSSHRESATQSSSDADTGAVPADIAHFPEKTALFGDLHVHTSLSFDAFVFGVRAMPEDAYRYAMGEEIKHPAGFSMQLDRPLDFQAVTDHAEYLGVVPQLFNADSVIGQLEIAQRLRESKTQEERADTFYQIIGALRDRGPNPLAKRLLDSTIIKDAWQIELDAAEKFNNPGTFTTFIAYEFTSSGDEQQNLHRNVIYRGDAGSELPFSSADSRDPEDLWDWMDEERENGHELLAIPHNSNGSDGMMFDSVRMDGSAFDAQYADQRMRNEPLVEITQVKGTSDTHPALSPTDEWADFELYPQRIASELPSRPQGSYVRQALRDGLMMSQRDGFNPYRFGLIGASDSHVAGGATKENDYWSKAGMLDATPMLRGSIPESEENGEPVYRNNRSSNFQQWSAAGLTGVWAHQNTRDGIYDALRAKETFATTGSRIKVRFFAGVGLDASALADGRFVSEGYAKGVAMGGEIAATAESPDFQVWALQDPMRAPLDRVQVIKGWVDEAGASHEQVYDVACAQGEVDTHTQRCPATLASVQLSDCSLIGEGASELSAHWSDPAYNPQQRAFYYVRVLENPSCRWTTWEALEAGYAPRPDVPATIQERAWSSPIWVNPTQAG